MRIGLVGAGRIGQMHARILRDLESVTDVLVADVDRSSSRALADAHGFTAADAVDEVFETGLDGMLVTAATSAHADLLRRSIKARVPVFVEKPLAVDVAGTVDLVHAIAESGVPVQLGFQRRFDPGYVEAKRKVDAGELGWVHTLRSCTLDPAPPTPVYVASSGGIFRDCAVHDFDSIRWMTGREIVSVSAFAANRGEQFFRDHDDADTATALLELDDGTLATASCTRYNAAGYDVRLEVFGARGSVSVGLDDRMPLRSTEPDVAFPAGPAYTGFQQRFAAAYRAEIATFVDSVVRDRQVSPCTPADALEAFYAAEAAELSRRERRAVTLEEVRR
ncbi:MAG TPA: Gfo/Idh/MocA family oxidoreductase [Nocardioidaceae bacterium]|nr:Gfo/Idh/MocA family oxidoreductase [Nocardioidaceae bacterium]